MTKLTLVHKSTGIPVRIGEVLTDFRGDHQRLIAIEEPRSPASTGRVYVADLDEPIDDPQSFGYYPSVFDLEWIGRTDR